MQEDALSLATILAFDLQYSCSDFDDDTVIHDYKGRLEVSYDGELFGIDRWEAPAGEQLKDECIENITLLGHEQAKTLALAILALLKVQDGIDVCDGEDFQERYAKMVSAAQDAHDQEAVAVSAG